MNNDNYPFNNQPSHHFPQSSFPNPIPEDDDDTPQLLSEPRRVNAGMGSRWIAHARMGNFQSALGNVAGHGVCDGVDYRRVGRNSLYRLDK